MLRRCSKQDKCPREHACRVSQDFESLGRPASSVNYSLSKSRLSLQVCGFEHLATSRR
jgi:hypothetical protein